MAVSDTLINTLFDGRYRIVRKLGSGGMANVYLAEDEELGRRVAIKILNDRYANDELFVERFRREAKSAAALSHPNIVSIYDRGEAEGTYYIAMEVIEGRSLKELILTRGPLPPEVAIAYAHQILSALRFAHRHGIIHRDIKPHNILIGPEDRLKVTDFGIARAGASQMTEAGSIMGTAQYLSPEQARGASVTEASDLYSVGIVLYEMLTGAVPFTGDTPVEIAMKHLNETPRLPSARFGARSNRISKELDQIVLRALAKDPHDRYSRAEELDSDLARAATGMPVSPETAEAATTVLMGQDTAATRVVNRAAATAPPRRPPSGRPPVYDPYDEHRRQRRPRILPWFLAAALLAVAALAGWYVYTQVQDQIQESKPVAVPLVLGLQEQKAIEKIREQGFEPEVERAPSDEASPGEVFDQKPSEGTRIEKGQTVTIVVSTGVEQVDVPSLRGLSEGEAIQALNEAGLKAKVVRVFSKDPEGTVTSQDPKPDAGQVAKGSAVTVRISKGAETEVVPDVFGQDQANAEVELRGAGFEVGVVTGPSDEQEGNVFQQAPDAGTEAAKGSTVQISVSTGPETVSVPNVVGLDQATATETLEVEGFGVGVVQTPTLNPDEFGIVLEQNPSGGLQADPGTQVTITVGAFVTAAEPPPPAEPPPTTTG